MFFVLEVDISSHKIDPVSWEIVTEWSDMHAALENKNNSMMKPTFASFFGDDCGWAGRYFTKAAMIASSAKAKQESESHGKVDQLGKEGGILTTAKANKKDSMAAARANRQPKKPMSTPMTIEDAVRPTKRMRSKAPDAAIAASSTDTPGTAKGVV